MGAEQKQARLTQEQNIGTCSCIVITSDSVRPLSIELKLAFSNVFYLFLYRTYVICKYQESTSIYFQIFFTITYNNISLTKSLCFF